MWGRVCREDCAAQQGVFASPAAHADDRREVCIVCGSHVPLPFNQGHVWTDMLQCTMEFMHVIVAPQSVSGGETLGTCQTGAGAAAVACC